MNINLYFPIYEIHTKPVAFEFVYGIYYTLYLIFITDIKPVQID